jgi:hypothetical protein
MRWFAFFSLLFVLVNGLLACEGEERTESQSKQNVPPAITSVQILPANPHVGNDLNLTVQCQDPDGDSISYEYQWLKNDQDIPGENGSSLKGENFRKGDTIRVRVIASDGKSRSEPVLSSAVRVLNSPPLVEEVLIEPRLAHGTDQLKAVVKAIDRDRDPIYYLYQWELKGVALPEEREERLGQGRCKKGDSVTVVVTPDDREVLGAPKRSEPVRISNSPPVIVSSPPLSIEGNIYLYQIRADDPDQDPVAFSLQLGPKGMGIDRETGLIRWEIRPEDKGIHSVEVEVSDPEGAKSLQRYSLAVEFR